MKNIVKTTQKLFQISSYSFSHKKLNNKEIKEIAFAYSKINPKPTDQLDLFEMPHKCSDIGLKELLKEIPLSDLFHNRSSFDSNTQQKIIKHAQNSVLSFSKQVNNYTPWSQSLGTLLSMPKKIYGSELYSANSVTLQGGIIPKELGAIDEENISLINDNLIQFILDCQDKRIETDTIKSIIEDSLKEKGIPILFSTGSIVDVLNSMKKIQENIGEELNMQFANLQFFLSSCLWHMAVSTKEKDGIIENQAIIMQCLSDILGERNIKPLLISHSNGSYIDLAAYLQICLGIKNDSNIPSDKKVYPKMTMHMLSGGTNPTKEFNDVIESLRSEGFIKNIDINYYQYNHDPIANIILNDCHAFSKAIKDGEIKMHRFGENLDKVTKDYESTAFFPKISLLLYKSEHKIEKYLIDTRFVLEYILEDVNYQKACYNLYKMGEAIENKNFSNINELSHEALEGFHKLSKVQEGYKNDPDKAQNIKYDPEKHIKYLNGELEVVELALKAGINTEIIRKQFNQLHGTGFESIDDCKKFIDGQVDDCKKANNSSIKSPSWFCGELTENSDGLFQDELEYNLKLIKKSVDDTAVNEKLALVSDLNISNNQKLYIINPEGIESKFNKTLQKALNNTANVINADIQRDNSTCSDHSLILLTKILELGIPLSEIGIATVENEHGKHANLYIIGDSNIDLSSQINKVINSYKQGSGIIDVSHDATDIIEHLAIDDLLLCKNSEYLDIQNNTENIVLLGAEIQA